MTTVLIDGQSVIIAVSWIIALVAWSYVLGTVLFHVMVNWWRIERAAVERWRSIPIVASIRQRRQREEWNYWWATRTPEQMAEWYRAKARMVEMTDTLTATIRSAGISMNEASEAFSAFAAVARTVDWDEVREYEASR